MATSRNGVSTGMVLMKELNKPIPSVELMDMLASVEAGALPPPAGDPGKTRGIVDRRTVRDIYRKMPTDSPASELFSATCPQRNRCRLVSTYQKDVKQDTTPKEGPDPKKPYFMDYVAQKKNATIPKDTFGPIFSNHNHFTACCVCPNGDVLAVWYSTVTEDGREVAQAATRLRNGSEQWEPASLFFDVPDVNDHAPVLLTYGKRILHFCTQSLKGWDYASNIIRYSDDNGVTWSKPTIMLDRDDPDALSQPCSAIVAQDGTIVVACDGDNHKDERLIRSKDGGKTWTVAKGDMRKAMGGKYVIHPTLSQRKDGALVSYLRGPNPMPGLVSKDMGDSWETNLNPIFGGSLAE